MWSQMEQIEISWWRHQMETFSALLAICAGNSPVTGEFPAQRPVTHSFDVFFDLHLNRRLSKQWWGWWFETPSRSLWRRCNVNARLKGGSNKLCSDYGPYFIIWEKLLWDLEGVLYFILGSSDPTDIGRNIHYEEVNGQIQYQSYYHIVLMMPSHGSIWDTSQQIRCVWYYLIGTKSLIW